MKMEKNKTKKIFAFIFLLLNIGSSLSVNTLFAQDEFEEFDFSAPLIEGSVFRSNYIDVHQTDLFKQVGDQLILLRNDTLFSLALNPDIDAPAEIISKRQIPAHSDGNPITDSEIIVTDELVIVLSGYKFEHENDAEISFYNLSSDGQLEFQGRYIFSKQEGEGHLLSYSMTVVDNNLVAIIPRQLDHESSLDVINQKQMTTLDVKRQIAGSPKMESLNLIKSNKWVNLFSLGQVVEEYSAVLKCPIDTLWDKGLQCDVTNIFGVRMNSFYFSRDSVYISSIYYPGSYYGVSAHSTEEYLQRNDHGVIVEDGAEVQSAFYRVDLDQGDVTAVLFDGSLLNLFSYQEIDDSFVAILKRSEDDEYYDSLYGLHFSLEKFSTMPTHLPESDYQYLTSRSGRISANRIFEDKIVLAKSTGRPGGPIKNELITWDMLDKKVSSVNSDFKIRDLYFHDDKLLTVGNNRNGALSLEVWSPEPKRESLFLKYYDQYWLSNLYLDESFLMNRSKQSVWGFPVYRLDANREPIEDEDGLNTIDMAYFEVMPDSSIKELGKLIANPQNLDGQCQLPPCENWYSLEQPFIVGDSVYAFIGDDVIKAAYTPEGLKPLNRFNLFSEEASVLLEEQIKK